MRQCRFKYDMASSSQPTLIFTTTEKLKNLIIIDYQCPPDPNHINHVLEMLINVTGLYVQSDPTKAQPIQNFITQIGPQLFSLYDQSVSQMLTHTGATLPTPQTVHVPYANRALQNILDGLKQVHSPTRYRINGPWLELSSNMAQSPNIIWILTPNIYSINKVFVQQILETIGQTTKENIDKTPEEMLKNWTHNIRIL